MKIIPLIIFGLLQFAVAEVFYTKLHLDEDKKCLILEQQTLRKFKGFRSHDPNELFLKQRPAVVEIGVGPILTPKSLANIIEIYGRREEILKKHLEKFCISMKNIQPLKFPKQNEPEVVKIIDGGDQGNRIDVVFMGDGYTATERDQFFSDIRRLTEDMFNGVTFRSYLPLFNIWAIYVPSMESGIGYDGPKNTPFRLYREEGQLRGIYPGNASYARQICRLTGAGGCDYPSLIGNDDYYGGLGGEFVISTKSSKTGTIVLRHEMGHNFADVGEEYDGGGVYSGVNAASSVASLGWSSWLTTPEAKEQKAVYRLLEYLWTDLGTQNVTLSFTSDGQYDSWYMVISVTAAGEEDSLEFLLDGEPLPWGSFGSDDREFYDWWGTEGFSAGSHTLEIRSKTPPTNAQIPRMVASVDLHEFGAEGEFHQDNSFVSAYPTWDYIGRKTFRPTNAGCLMRNMTHDKFCPVCQEGIWSQFLQRISLIDGIEIDMSGNPDAPRPVKLKTLALGPLRQEGNEVPGEKLEVRWTRNGMEQVFYNDLFEILAQNGQWRVKVTFTSPEIRDDPLGLLEEEEQFTIA